MIYSRYFHFTPIPWQIARKNLVPSQLQPTLTQRTIDSFSKNINPCIPIPAPQQEASDWLGIPIHNLLTPSPTHIPMANGVQAQALHINGLNPHTEQHFTYLMTCNPCIRVHDIKEIIKDILHVVSDNPIASYDQV